MPEAGAVPVYRVRAAHLAVVTLSADAARATEMPLLRMMLASLRALPGSGTLPVACFDLGLTDAERRELAADGVEPIAPRHRFEVPDGPWPGWLGAYLAQPFLRVTLPGRDVYLWIDADSGSRTAARCRRPSAARWSGGSRSRTSAPR
jgi:hypothetical protein